MHGTQRHTGPRQASPRSLTLHLSLALGHRGEGTAAAISNARTSGLPVSQTGSTDAPWAHLSLEPWGQLSRLAVPTAALTSGGPAPPGGRVTSKSWHHQLPSPHAPLPPSSPQRHGCWGLRLQVGKARIRSLSGDHAKVVHRCYSCATPASCVQAAPGNGSAAFRSVFRKWRQ